MASQQSPGLLDRLTAEHDALRARFTDLAGMPPGDPRRGAAADAVSAALARHLAAEEEFLYPRARRSRPLGDHAVDDGLAAHAALRALLRELDRIRFGDADFDRLVARVLAEATGHFRLEEAQIFDAVRGDLSDHTLDVLGERARSAEAATPPRPQP